MSVFLMNFGLGNMKKNSLKGGKECEYKTKNE